MAKTPVYEKNVSTQLSPQTTTRMSREDPMGAALQSFGRGVSNVANVAIDAYEAKKQDAIKQQEKIEEQRKLAQKIKDDGHETAAKINLIDSKTDFDRRFNDEVIRGKESISNYPSRVGEFYKEKNTELAEGWQGSPDKLKIVQGTYALRRAEDMGKAQSEVNKFELDRAIYSFESGYERALFANDPVEQANYSSKLKSTVGEEKFAVFAADKQKAFASNLFVAPEDLASLNVAEEQMKDGSAWEGLDHLTPTDKSDLARQNTTQQARVKRLIQDQQFLNSLTVDEQIMAGVLDPLQLEVLRREGEIATSPNENVGLSKSQALAAQKALDAMLKVGVPADDFKKLTKLEATIKKNNFFAGPNNYESVLELEKYQDSVLSSDLPDKTKYYLFSASSRIFAKYANPAVQQDLIVKVSTLSQIEAKAIQAGIPITFGQSSYDFLKSLKGDNDLEKVQLSYDRRIAALQPLVNQAILNEMQTKPIAGNPFDPATAKAGTKRADSSGAMWTKLDNGKWKKENN